MVGVHKLLDGSKMIPEELISMVVRKPGEGLLAIWQRVLSSALSCYRCVCVHVCECVCVGGVMASVHMDGYPHVCGGWRSTLGVFLNHSLLYLCHFFCYKDSHWTYLELTNSAELVDQLAAGIYLTLYLSAGISCMHHHAWLFMSVKNSNSSPHALCILSHQPPVHCSKVLHLRQGHIGLIHWQSIQIEEKDH